MRISYNFRREKGSVCDADDILFFKEGLGDFMKRILLLGGSAQQLIAIETAKRLGYYTIVCDYLTDNPGQYICDKFYLESTTDKETILKIAKEEQIDGILAYASDPAATTAAYVAEQLGLPTNPANAVEILCNKDRFRTFLSENGFQCPAAKGYTKPEDAIHDLKEQAIEFPVIIKPVDSSGSKGVTVLREPDGIEDAVAFAFSFSRGKRIVVESFIEKKHPYLIGGDIFVYDGTVMIWGLMNCFRTHSMNPLVPGGKMYPVSLEAEDLKQVQETLQDMVTKLGIQNGCMNVELVVDQKNRVFPIDIGPRAGGNMIPIQLSHIFGVDIVEMSLKCAMGEELAVQPEIKIPYCATYVLHADVDGIYQDITFDEEIESHIFKKALYKKPGDTVEHFDNAAKALGIIFLQFSSADEMLKLMNEMQDHVKVVLQ